MSESTDESRLHDQRAAHSYDAAPYVSRALWYAHPDALATVALLSGLDPAPVESCRVLELGCASAGHLLPMAEALPGSTFVGIDISPAQVGQGRRIVETMRLRNVRLETKSILDIPDAITADFGEFDYIIAHGVYSWVPAPVREKILAACRGHLAPHGVAYVSYNTYPGWHARAMVREMMLYHVDGIGSPTDRAEQAYALVRFLHDNAAGGDEGFRGVLRKELQLLDDAGLNYAMHEHLETHNQPFYFREFAGAATKHGLQYLGESRQAPLNLTPAAQQFLSQMSGDRVRVEQYLDFLRNRAFRWSLLVHDGLKLNTLSPLEGLRRVRVAGRIKYDASAEQLASSSEKVKFTVGDEGSLVVADAATKRALVALADVFPRSLAFDELIAIAQPPADDATFADGLATLLLRSFLVGMVQLHAHEPAFVTEISDRPAVSALQRLCAASGLSVTGARHIAVHVDDLGRVVMGHLDGSRSRGELLAALQADLRAGRFAVSVGEDSSPPTDAQVREYLEARLDQTLRQLATAGLLVG